MTTDINSALYDVRRSFELFKENNDQRLKEIARNGTADPLTELKVNRLNAEISRAQDTADSARRRMDLLETAFNRTPLSGVKSDEHAEAALFALERKQHYTAELDVGTYRNYKSAFRDYLRKNNAGSPVDEIKALSVGSDPDGGFAVTPDMTGRIVSLIYETSPIRQVANVVTIGSDALEGVNDLTQTTSGWIGETASRVESTSPQIGQWRIPVYEQYAEPHATQKILDDALFDVEGWLSGKIADRLARMENTAFVSGNGIQQPRGFLTYASGVPTSSTFNVMEQIASGASGAFPSTSPGDSLISLVYALKAAYRDKAVFVLKRATLAQVRMLKDAQGRYLWQPDFQMRQGGTLLGYNVVEAEDMPTMASNSLSIAFGNFDKGYQIVDRQGIRVLRDSFTAKPYVKFYTTKRVGGDVVNFEAIKLMRFSVS